MLTDWALRRTVGHGENGIRWKFTSKLDDADFADDVLLISCAKQQIQDKTAIVEEQSRQLGLKINMEKIKAITINAENQERIMMARLGKE